MGLLEILLLVPVIFIAIVVAGTLVWAGGALIWLAAHKWRAPGMPVRQDSPKSLQDTEWTP